MIKNRVRRRKLPGLVLFVLMTLLVQGCSKSHILFQREGISRTWIYIDFTKNETPYENQSIVGGEHMTFYKVLGFEGDEFVVTVETIEGNVMWGVMGDQVNIEPVRESNTEKKYVTVVDTEAIFTIDFSAHPFGQYKLTIEKMPRCNEEQ
ncbi:hypothetical protein [uncultured Desulfobacter sp.]|uniref:hypothetical protein n=1 Tax=uncultured Desulfobacter sp. TaxID=240139 RepID=UPI002AAB90D0|nr:hypothetical protein [uncultured Desulfobacter sp.]